MVILSFFSTIKSYYLIVHSIPSSIGVNLSADWSTHPRLWWIHSLDWFRVAFYITQNLALRLSNLEKSGILDYGWPWYFITKKPWCVDLVSWRSRFSKCARPKLINIRTDGFNFSDFLLEGRCHNEVIFVLCISVLSARFQQINSNLANWSRKYCYGFVSMQKNMEELP